MGLLSKVFGGKSPDAVPYKPVNVQAEQAKAVSGNLANLPNIQALVSQVNAFSQQQANSLMERALPGFSGLQQRFVSQATSDLENPYALPEGVEQNIERLAAERGISTGTAGQTRDFSLLRDFGVNSLQFGNQSLGRAQSIFQLLSATAPNISPVSPLAMAITPAQQIAVATDNNTKQQAIAQGAENAKAAAYNQSMGRLWNLVGMIASPLSSGSVTGAGGGGGGGAPSFGAGGAAYPGAASGAGSGRSVSSLFSGSGGGGASAAKLFI